MGKFYKLLKKVGIQRKYIILLLLRSPFDAIRTWTLAGLMKSVFLCVEMKNIEKIAGICIFYGLLRGILFLYNGTVWSIYAAFSARMEVWLQKQMLKKILNLPLKEVESRRSGDWITNLNSDIQAAITMMNGPMNMPHAVVAVINTMLSSFLLLQSNLFLFGVMWVFILPHLFINYKIVLKSIPKWKEESQKAMAESTSAIMPLITEAETILLYDAGDFMMQKCEESSRKLMKINMKIHKKNAASNVVFRLFGVGGYFAILFIGCYFIYNGTMAFSDMVYCIQVRGSILAGIFMLFTCLNNIKANAVCMERIGGWL